MTQRLVWYVSYGSNLAAERFGCYLAGGCPPGAQVPQRGCRDATPARADAPLRVPGRLLFAGFSSVWGGGGVGFYDPDAGGEVLARGWLIGAGQFADVAAQEMGRPLGSVRVGEEELATLGGGGRISLGPGWYETLVGLGEFRGATAVTFTRRVPPPAGGLRLAAPSTSYLTTIGAGLREAHRLPVAEAAAYLAGCPGAAGAWSAAAVQQALAERLADAGGA